MPPSYRSTRRDFLKKIGIASISANVFERAEIRKKPFDKSFAARPNVVFIMADDMGWGDVEAYNPEFIRGASKEGPRGDMNALVDWCIGEVRRALEAHDVLDDTILIFTSDNGPRRGAKSQKSAGSFRGYKNSAYEGGHRIPFIVRWPRNIKPGTISDVPISLTDMMSTFAEFLDYSLPDSAAEDSISILPAILGDEDRKIQRPALIADTGGHVSELAIIPFGVENGSSLK